MHEHRITFYDLTSKLLCSASRERKVLSWEQVSQAV